MSFDTPKLKWTILSTIQEARATGHNSLEALFAIWSVDIPEWLISKIFKLYLKKNLRRFMKKTLTQLDIGFARAFAEVVYKENKAVFDRMAEGPCCEGGVGDCGCCHDDPVKKE